MLGRFISGILLALLAACIQTARPSAAPPAALGSALASPAQTPTPNPDTVGPENFPTGINPLTGLAVADDGVLARRPLVAKISNAPPLVRPQAGIGAADLVFEHYAEAGLTRFSAIFYSQTPQRVGSIRSARLIDYELLPMYRGLLAYSGASNGVQALIDISEFAERTYHGVIYGNPFYWRDETIAAPHNMFMNPAMLWDLATREGLNEQPELRGMAFNPQPPNDATRPAQMLDVRYFNTRAQWEYDPVSERYLRTSDGQPHRDANSGEQVSAANVVVLFANHTFTDIVESEFQGDVFYSIEMQLWFEGDAFLLRDGQLYVGRWLRPTRESMISLTTRAGEILPFKPGNTWFQVVRPPEQQDPEDEWVRVG